MLKRLKSKNSECHINNKQIEMNCENSNLKIKDFSRMRGLEQCTRNNKK